jgi:uncharacterized protein (TIGR01615 family)
VVAHSHAPEKLRTQDCVLVGNNLPTSFLRRSLVSSASPVAVIRMYKPVSGRGVCSSAPRTPRSRLSTCSADGDMMFMLEDCTPPRQRTASLTSVSAPDVHLRLREALVMPSASLARNDITGSAAVGGSAALQLLEEMVTRILGAHASSDIEGDQVADEVASQLAQAGFHCTIICESAQRAASSGPSMPFRPFLLVTAYTWGLVSSESVDVQAIVDFDFRSRFVVHAPSEWYQEHLAFLPDVFVGTAEGLEDVVSRMARLIRSEFAAKDMSLPPWRSADALLSIWFPFAGRRGLPYSPPVFAQRTD